MISASGDRTGRASALLVASLIAGSMCSVASAMQDGMTSRSQHAYPTGNSSTSVILVERLAPPEIRVGFEFEYQVRLTNLTSGQVENVVFTEQLPDGLEIKSIDPQPQSRGAVATWEFASLAPKSSQVIRIRAVPGRTGEISSCATVTFSTETCSSIQVVEPALALTKTQPEEVLLCDPIPIRLEVTNTGSGVARNVEVHDQLPDGWTTTDNKSDVIFQAGNLNPGQSRQFTITARSSQTGDFSNVAAAKGDGGLSAQASDATRVVKPELEVVKTGPDIRFVGRPARFNLTVRNTGNAPARDTMLVDTLPGDLTFMDASDNGQFAGGRVTWNLGTLAPGDSRDVSVSVQAGRIGSHLNRAQVTAYCADASAEATLQVRGIPAILLEVVDLDDPIELGAQETYEIVVTNQGSAEGTNIVIECVLPPEQEFVSANGPTGGSASGKRITFAPLPSLAPKASTTYRVISKGTGTGDTRFKVVMTSDQLTSPVEETESTHIY